VSNIQAYLNNIPIFGNYPWLIAVGILGVVACWIVFRVLRMRGRKSVEKPEEIIELDDVSLEGVEEVVEEEKQAPITSEEIAAFFLKIYKAQLGVSPGAVSEIKPLASESIAPKMTYELRVAYKGGWETRRMTVGPLGSDGASRSQCFTVIYDNHLVLKIPQKPIRDFRSYIDDILSDQKIVKKLSPRECIVPSVSAILRKIHHFSEVASLSPFELEERYISWLDKFPNFQELLKIGESFVFVMDLSKYFFLGHVIDDFHDLNNRLYQEIVGYPAVIWDNHGFEGRYGFENDEAVDGIKAVFSFYKEKVSQLLKLLDPANSVDSYALRKWFLIHLAGKTLHPSEKGLNPEMVEEINLLILNVFEEMKDPVGDYRNTVRGCIQSVTVGQNKPQMGGLISKMLNLLVWLKTKGVAMRDLKPDNLLIVGDPTQYPDFLKSTRDFNVGLIDVETAADYNRNPGEEIEQPILGGTPSYAVPAHLCGNDSLTSLYGDLGRILYLQDWFAFAGMIYEVILGERLFDQTGKLLVGIKNLVLKTVQGQQEFHQAFKKASQMFWYAAVNEFNVKTGDKEEHLKTVEVVLPEQGRDMLRKELLKCRSIIAARIKRYVNTQTVFKEEKICQGLICASREKISKMKTKLTDGISDSPKMTVGKATAVRVLDDLLQLKLQSENLSRLIKELGKPELILNAHDLIELIFDIVLQAMYRQEWGELSAAEGIELEEVNEATTIEATV
jgi:serine/threonine protein kinase